MTKITKNIIDSIPEDCKNQYLWDGELKGFGVRIQGKARSWIIKYRNQYGKQCMYTIAKISSISATEARKKAEQMLADIKLNDADPSQTRIELRNDLSVSELCELYLTEGVLNKKPSTIDGDKSRVRSHINPLIGNYPINSLNKQIIERMMLDITNGKTSKTVKSDKARGMARVTGGRATAKRVFETLSSILTFAQRRELIDENPAIGVPKPKLKAKEVFLTIDEYKDLGKALKIARQLKFHQTSLDAIELLALTGCRKGEILTLKWEYIDFKNQCFRFPDTKTGKQNRAFGVAALNLLTKLQENKTSEWVFPASTGDGCLVGAPKVFKRMCDLRPLKEENGKFIQDPEASKFIKKDISLHTLRHSFASMGADMGYVELTIAGLLGHKLGTITSRYSHNVDTSLINAADKISLKIENALNGTDTKDNVIQFKKSI